jgi:biotin operon repressor
MLYERSRQIEERLDRVLHMIDTGEYSTPLMATELGVSIPTISRCVTALRERGNDIQAEKRGAAWHYVLFRKTCGVEGAALTKVDG